MLPVSQHPVQRKLPRQSRSNFTVHAVLDATICVLLNEGPQRLTTTRVAERAGVSIGTLYQYYDNRLALLYAAHRRHLRRTSELIVKACRSGHGQTLSTMVRSVVVAFVESKLGRIDEARALYLVTPELTAADMVTPETLEVRQEAAEMLATATDVSFADVSSAGRMFVFAMVGPMRAALEQGVGIDALRAIGVETVTLCDAYLHSIARSH